MITHEDKHCIGSDPPSVCAFMMAEHEFDRRILAELIDIGNANRAPTTAHKIAGMSGRVMVNTLAESLGITSSSDPIDVEQVPLLKELRETRGLDPQECLRRGFHVRFFQW